MTDGTGINALHTDPRIAEFNRRAGMAKGQIMEALGSLATLSRYPEVYHAEKALRRALAELNGRTCAGEAAE